jgi:hypothetical protein
MELNNINFSNILKILENLDYDYDLRQNILYISDLMCKFNSFLKKISRKNFILKDYNLLRQNLTKSIYLLKNYKIKLFNLELYKIIKYFNFVEFIDKLNGLIVSMKNLEDYVFNNLKFWQQINDKIHYLVDEKYFESIKEKSVYEKWTDEYYFDEKIDTMTDFLYTNFSNFENIKDNVYDKMVKDLVV